MTAAERSHVATPPCERVGDNKEVIHEERARNEERDRRRVAKDEAREWIGDRDERANKKHREDREQDHQRAAEPSSSVHLPEAG